MLLRRVGGAAVSLLADGQGAALLQGFRHQQQQWQWGAAAAAAAASPPPPAPAGLRWHSELARPRGQQEQDFEYVAPFGTTVSRVKKLSLFSCACALSAGPIIIGLDAGGSLMAKGTIVATLASFGVFTTGLLTWFTQPYVTRLRFERGSDTVEAHTLSLWARPRVDRFHVGEVREALGVHPLASFEARGRRYYLDADNFPDKALLARLVPQATAAAVMEAANAEQQAAQQQQQQQQRPGGEQRQAPH